MALFAGSQDSVGCAVRGGKRYFITTSVYHAPVPTRPGPGTAVYGISRFLYEVGPGPVLTPVGYQGEDTSSNQRAYEYSNDCGTETTQTQLTEAPRLWPGTAAEAVTGLVQAAQARDQVTALTFIGGDRGTFIPVNGAAGDQPDVWGVERGFQPDVWTYLTDPRNRPLLAAAQSRQPVQVGRQNGYAGRYTRYELATSAGALWFAVAWNGPASLVAGVWSSALH